MRVDPPLVCGAAVLAVFVAAIAAEVLDVAPAQAATKSPEAMALERIARALERGCTP